MEITGPFLDKAKKRNGQPSCWFLRYSTPKLNPDKTLVVGANGLPVLQRHRPYYASKAKAEADIPNLTEQHGTTGAGKFLFDRTAAADYEAAIAISGGVPLLDVAKFWRLHHPQVPKQKLRELLPEFKIVSSHHS